MKIHKVLCCLSLVLGLIGTKAQASQLYVPGKTFKARWCVANQLAPYIGQERASIVKYLGAGNTFGRHDRLYYLIGKARRTVTYLWVQVNLEGDLIRHIELTSNPD